MFVKLNKQFANIKYSSGDEEVSYGGVISYLQLNELNQNLLEVIPKNYQQAFTLSLMKVSGEIPPHTDSDVKAVINFYVDPSYYKTVFFDGESPSFQIKNQTNGKIFIRDFLSESDSFIAKSGDVFCLDVSKPHSVDKLREDAGERVAICLSTWDYDFDQVCNMLYDTGYVN